MKFTSKSISIISFNAMSAFNFNTIHGLFLSKDITKRLPKTAKILEEQNSDIITLQEVHTYFILKLLKKTLPTYPHVAYKKYFYGPRGGLVIFSKLPLEETEYFDFKKRGAFTNSSFVAHLIKNGVLMCKLKEIPVYILNTHLTPNLDFNWTEKNRFYSYINAQLHQIAQLVNKIGSNKNHVILAGDLNTSKNSKLYKSFLSEAKLVDIFAEFNTPTLHQEYLAKNKTARRIDYIFLSSSDSKPAVLKKDHVFTEKVLLSNGKLRYLSDHIGLSATINFKN